MTFLLILQLLGYIAVTFASPIDTIKRDSIDSRSMKRDEAHPSFNLTIAAPNFDNDFALDCGESRTNTFYCGSSPRSYYCDVNGNVKHSPTVGNQVCDDICRCVNLKARPGCYVPVASHVICHGDLKRRDLEEEIDEARDGGVSAESNLSINVGLDDEPYTVQVERAHKARDLSMETYDNKDADEDQNTEPGKDMTVHQKRDTVNLRESRSESITHNHTKFYDYNIPTHLVLPNSTIDADQLARLAAFKHDPSPDFIRPTLHPLEGDENV